MWEISFIIVLTAGSPTGELIPEGNTTDIEIVALYPNTIHQGNDGEFIVVSIPERTNLSGWLFLDDGIQSAKPPPIETEGVVAFSHHPALVEGYLDMPVYQLEGWLQLAVDGETVTLEIDGIPVDSVGYDTRAPRANLWIRDESDPWVPLSATTFDPAADSASVTTFVLPDSPTAVIEVLDSSTERIYLGGYELGDEILTDALIEAAARGLEVTVHAEGRPVGGITKPYANALDALVEADIPVTVHRGPYARYGYHHPKYIIADDRLLVTTENFKPAGTGGQASRGWAVVIESAKLADEAAAVFHADSDWRDAIDWDEVRDELNRHAVDPANGSYPEGHPPSAHEQIKTTLIVAPDNAEEALRELLASAEDSIHIKQVSISDPDFPLLAEAIDRARSGVSVKILLADRWYVRDENRELAKTLDHIAEAEGLDIEVALVDRTSTFDRIHAKGIVVDDRAAAVGSINWNNHSLRNNREVAVILEGESVADYFIEVFEADWPATTTDRWTLPIAFLIAALAAAGLVGEHARRLHLEGVDAQEKERFTQPD